jgi:hypothetical protein
MFAHELDLEWYIYNENNDRLIIYVRINQGEPLFLSK